MILDTLEIPIVLAPLAGGPATVDLAATGRGVAAVLAAGARATQIGTAFLRCPEAGTSEDCPTNCV